MKILRAGGGTHHWWDTKRIGSPPYVQGNGREKAFVTIGSFSPQTLFAADADSSLPWDPVVVNSGSDSSASYASCSAKMSSVVQLLGHFCVPLTPYLFFHSFKWCLKKSEPVRLSIYLFFLFILFFLCISTKRAQKIFLGSPIYHTDNPVLYLRNKNSSAWKVVGAVKTMRCMLNFSLKNHI